MNKKIVFGIAIVTMFLALCYSADAQQPTRISRIGYVVRNSVMLLIKVVILKHCGKDYAKLSYIEGKNIVIEFRCGEGERVKRLSQACDRACVTQGRCS